MRFSQGGLVVVVALFAQSSALQLPFNIPFLSTGPQNPLSTTNVLPTAPLNKVAIVGAGAAGSSAAFWIAKAQERFGIDIEVDVFERNDYVGGRSTVVYPYGNTELEAVELGASIFIPNNKNLWRATEEFGLDRIDFGGDDDVLGIWDGSQFLLTTGGSPSWWDAVKVIWRYGFQASRRTQAIVDAMVNKFITLYEPDAPRFDNLSTLAEQLEWTPVIARTAAEHLDTHGVDRRWTRELVDAMTRVNYGQNVDAIHALEGLCSLATTGASSVKGGNFQIFENFLARSGASVHLNTSVVALMHDEASSAWRLMASGDHQMQAYRAVILAAPFHQSNIALSPESLVAEVQPDVSYVHLHVTLLSTPSPTPSPHYFGVSSGKVSTTVLTTFNAVREGTGNEPEFNSLSYHGKIKQKDGTAWQGPHGEEWVVKIFSKQRVSDEWLQTVFGKVGWVLRKEWDAYPVLPPTTSFPPIKLAKGLYYVNAFEPFISTMETETISARNVVDLLLRDEFDAGICPPKAEEEEAEKSEAVVMEVADVPEEYEAVQTPEVQPLIPQSALKTKGKEKAVPAEREGFVLGWDC